MFEALVSLLNWQQKLQSVWVGWIQALLQRSSLFIDIKVVYKHFSPAFSLSVLIDACVPRL